MIPALTEYRKQLMSDIDNWNPNRYRGMADKLLPGDK
jgi:hypothetical protein